MPANPSTNPPNKAVPAPPARMVGHRRRYWSVAIFVLEALLFIMIGLIVFAVTRAFQNPATREKLDLKAAQWVVPWFVGMVVLGYLGRYNNQPDQLPLNLLPDGIDVLIIAVFALAVYYWAVSCARPAADVIAAVDREHIELQNQPEITTA